MGTNHAIVALVVALAVAAAGCDGFGGDGDVGLFPVGVGGPQPFPPMPGNASLMFVTSDTWTGDLAGAADLGNGVAAADRLCSWAASEVEQVFGVESSTWRAWISEGTASALSRMNVSGPLYLTDHSTRVFDRIGSISEPALAPIAVDERGVSLPVNEPIWTGTGLEGQATGSDCDGWTRGDYDEDAAEEDPRTIGTHGLTGDRDEWSTAGRAPCSRPAHLLCIQQLE